MNTISLSELREKLDRGDDFKLVMTLNEWAFQMSHIPGSINISNIEQASDLLSPDDEIIVYCSNPACPASIFAYHFLRDHGYKNVHRFAGGLLEWENAGYLLEGESVALAYRNGG